MSYNLGQKLVSDNQKAVVVAIRASINDEWQIQQGLADVDYDNLESYILEGLADQNTTILAAWGQYEDMWITEADLQYYDSWNDDEDWTHLVTEEEAAKQKEVADKIVALLKAHNLETSDLIVSDGRAYVGYTACANYIETTGAWVPSSMQC